MRAHKKQCFGCLVAMGLVLGLAASTRAQGLDQIGSLKWIPANASFYSTSLRMKEQLDIALQSKAWAKLSSLPFVQQNLQMMHAQIQANPQAAAVFQMLEQPENKQLLGLLGAMISEEVFLYGDASWGPLLKGLAESNSAMQFGGLSAALAARDQPGQMDQMAQVRAMLRGLMKSRASLRIPTLVLGFRVKDEAAAKAQLKRLEELVKGLPVPPEHPLHKMITAKSIGSGRFITVEADGSMVPWDQIPIGSVEEKPGEFKPLFDHLRNQKLRIALGYDRGYMFFVLGDSFDFLEKLGAGPNLAGRSEFKPVQANANKRLTSIGYISKDFRESAASGNLQSFASLADLGKQALDKLELTDDQKARLTKDLGDLSHQVQEAQPKFGGAVSFSFLTERGSESYAYDWMGSSLDGSKPLSLLNHVGGSPIFASVARTKSDPGGYDKMEAVIAKLYAYAVEIGLPRVPAENRPQVQMALEKLVPIVKKLSATTRNSFIPGFGDSQFGFVIDGKLEVSHLHLSLPAFPKQMPLPEFALVLGVSDAKLVRQAFTEYRATLNELFAALREINPMAPAIEIPEAKRLELKSGVAYSYPMFGQLGVDPQIMPAAGLGEKVAVLALSPDHVGRLLASQQLKVDGGPLADLKKPRASASVFNFPAVIDMLKPWYELGVLKAQEAGGAQLEAQNVKDAMEQLKTVFELLKVFKGGTSSTYFEGDAVVTHSESVVRDI